MKSFYITTAIDYINGLPHIGTAYEKITADFIARSKRLLGYDVRFCMGTDEHSINVKKKAVEEGLSPKDYCDRMAPKFEAIWKKLDISYDDFIRTTEPRHVAGVTEIFRRIQETGDIYTADYDGLYCEGCESFIQEKDLVDGACPHHRTKPSRIQETNYFFRLSRYGAPLLDHIRNNPSCIRPESRRNEILKLIEGGLEDVSVSRSGFDWGIALPDDPGHVVYVWFDALVNYISALGFGSDDQSLVDRYWPADLHVIGKDITRFHCVIWPAMLMSAGIPVPQTVFGHGFIYHSGERMSKSLGNVVSPLDVVDRFGADPLRLFLLKEVVYGLDGDFTYDRFIERYNSDLANDLGNLISRTTTMISKYCGGQFSATVSLPSDGVASQFPTVLADWTAAVESYNLSGACERVWDMIRAANRRIEETAPWKLARDPERAAELEAVLYDLLAVVGGVAVLLFPAMPSAMAALWKTIGFGGEIDQVRVESGMAIPQPPRGNVIPVPPALFPRIDASRAPETATATASEKAAPTPASVPAQAAESDGYLSFDDFKKVELRVGTVLAASPVKGSEKLLRLTIDDGTGGRTILAGIAKFFSPDDLVGNQVVFVANLKPRPMMGELSEGMVLAASDTGGLAVLRPSRPVKPGSSVN